MRASLTPDEFALFTHVPEADLVELAAELDLAIPAVIDRRELLEKAVVALAQVGRTRGLPLSPYDRDDLAALPPEHLRALAALCGTSPTVDALLKSGKKSYKLYKNNLMSPIPMMVPMLLRPLARYASEVD
jgi:hypothetical protein